MYEKAVPGGSRGLAERRCFSLITQNLRAVAACEVLHEEIVAQSVCDVQITASVAHIASGEEHFARGTFRTASTTKLSRGLAVAQRRQDRRLERLVSCHCRDN
jgi:hypothetical protein